MQSPGGMGPDLGFAKNKRLRMWRQWKNTGRAVVGLGGTVPGASRCAEGSAGRRGAAVPIGGSEGTEPPRPSRCTQLWEYSGNTGFGMPGVRHGVGVEERVSECMGIRVLCGGCGVGLGVLVMGV